MIDRYHYQDSPCKLCVRLAEEKELLQQQLDLAVEVIAQQIEMLEEMRTEAEDFNMRNRDDFGFRN